MMLQKVQNKTTIHYKNYAFLKDFSYLCRKIAEQQR